MFAKWVLYHLNHSASQTISECTTDRYVGQVAMAEDRGAAAESQENHPHCTANFVLGTLFTLLIPLLPYQASV
jgi:hypothetical protein